MGRCYLLERLEHRLLLTGDTGQVLVFADGPIDFATGQFKAPVEKTIGHLGQYDANGNLVGSNNGLLTGKWGSTEIYSLDEQDPQTYGSLGSVPELNSPTNDFRVDYTGKTQNDKRAGILQSSQANFYYWIDDYRTRFLTDSFIDSLNLPAQATENLKHLQYRPDLQSTPAPVLVKPNLRTFEGFNSVGLLYGQVGSFYLISVRSRAPAFGYDSLAPVSLGFDGENIIGDWIGLASTWIAGFDQVWTGAFSYPNSTNILAALSDGISNWGAYRYSGNSEVYKYTTYSNREWGSVPSGGSRVNADKGYNIRNVMMFDEANTTADGVFPYQKPSSWVQFQGPANEELASIFFSAVLYDIANEAGLGVYKTDQLMWKSVSLITNPTSFTVRNWGDTLLDAAAALWPKPGDPTQSLYEADLVDVLTSRGIPVNGVADFRTNLPAAIGPTPTGNNFSSSHPNSQPNVNSYGVFNNFIDSYTTTGSPGYVAYQFYKHSKYGPSDALQITDGTFNATTRTYNNDGTYFLELTDRELGNMVLLLPGATVRWQTIRGRAPNENQGFYAEDVRPFGFRVIGKVSDGYSFTSQTVGETSTTKTYETTVVDPSLATLGAATYAWTITDYQGSQTVLNGQTVQFTVEKDQPFTIKLDRTRGTTESMTWRERGSDLDRNNGNALVRDMVTGSMSGQIYLDTNGNGARDFAEAPLPGVTVYLDTNNNGSLDSGEPSTVTGLEGLWSFTGTGPGTYHVRQILPAGYVRTSGNAVYDVTLTTGSRNQRGFDFAQFPTSFLGSLGNDTFTIVDKPGDSSRVQITEGPAGGTITWEVLKSAIGNHLLLHLSAGDDVINSSASGITLSLDSAGGNKTLNVTAGSLTLDNDPGAEDPVKTANEPVNLTINVSGGAQINFASTEHLAALNVADGATAAVPANGSRVIVTRSLSITGAGKLDLADNAMVVDWTGSNPIATILSLLTSGYASGAWNGSGIHSSVAATTPGRALGYAESSALFSNFPAMFAGQEVDNTAVLVRYTRYGDADLNQMVNLSDFNRLAGSFGTGNLWSQGNFNFDSAVNLNDFNLLAGNFGLPVAPSARVTASPFAIGKTIRDALLEEILN